MGGVTDAKDVVFKALKKGKHVVTANKALLAQLLPEVRVVLQYACLTLDEQHSKVARRQWLYFCVLFYHCFLPTASCLRPDFSTQLFVGSPVGMAVSDAATCTMPASCSSCDTHRPQMYDRTKWFVKTPLLVPKKGANRCVRGARL